MRQNSINNSHEFSFQVNNALHCNVKLQLVLFFSILLSFSTPAPQGLAQAASCSSRFHAISLQNVATAVLRSAGPLRAGTQEKIGLSCIHMHYTDCPPISTHYMDFLPRICHIITYFLFEYKICISAYFKRDLPTVGRSRLKYALLIYFTFFDIFYMYMFRSPYFCI